MRLMIFYAELSDLLQNLDIGSFWEGKSLNKFWELKDYVKKSGEKKGGNERNWELITSIIPFRRHYSLKRKRCNIH